MFIKKFWQKNKRIFKFIFFSFIVWQAAIVSVSFLSSRILPARERFMYNDRVLWNRANFEGSHYLQISRNGYGLHQQAFFPLYSELIRFFTPLFGGKDLLVGTLISNLSLLIFMFLLYKLVCLDYQELVAKRALVFFLFFPTSFFMGMVYTEALFLMLAVGSFYAARKKKWLIAGILGGLASYTRLVGIFLFPALLYEWWSEKKIQSFLPLLLVPLGLLSYMKFLWQRFGDPLMFFHVQPYFGVERSGGRIILIYQVFWRYFKMVLTTKIDPLYFTVWLEVLVAIGFLILLLLACRAKIRFSYLIFSAFAYFIPSFSGTFSSLPRYVLAMFPCFIYLGLIKSRVTDKIVWTVFGLLFIISSILFFRGYWVS